MIQDVGAIQWFENCEGVLEPPEWNYRDEDHTFISKETIEVFRAIHNASNIHAWRFMGIHGDMYLVLVVLGPYTW